MSSTRGGDDVVNVQDGAAELSVSCGEGSGDLAIVDDPGFDRVDADCETLQRPS
ncbi:hypothetical protein ITP53_05465 [Nonomuraea sp. K274]|uniref:Uncharacterized protein n=1 Tax=Nonomuraea cypriaca TaxID=1187855 RepID=A0A931EX72_9ACTN|nr:hypothetical protein [Nonomuraea cypriaca]MBF8185197.1 hypothetical protein [Nonomuraea cypriaca]